MGGSGIVVTLLMGGSGIVVALLMGGSGIVVALLMGGSGVVVALPMGGAGVVVALLMGGAGIVVALLMGGQGIVGGRRPTTYPGCTGLPAAHVSYTHMSQACMTHTCTLMNHTHISHACMTHTCTHMNHACSSSSGGCIFCSRLGVVRGSEWPVSHDAIKQQTAPPTENQRTKAKKPNHEPALLLGLLWGRVLRTNMRN